MAQDSSVCSPFSRSTARLQPDKTRSFFPSVLAELDCLLSLAKASADLDEPKCRPTIVESEQSFIDFKDLRHPAMCLRSDFISNDVQLGGAVPRQALLTGPSKCVRRSAP